MEKAWFCCCRLFAVCILGLFFSIDAYASTRVVQIEVEVPVVPGDSASTLRNAQVEAFRKSIQKVFSSEISPEDLASRVRRPQNYINGFRLLSQREEAGKLIAQYECEVVLDAASVVEKEAEGTRQGYYYDDRFSVELTWAVGSSRNIHSLRERFESELGLRVRKIGVQRGSAVFEVLSSEDPERVSRRIRSLVGVGASVRWYRPESVLGSDFNEF